MGGSKEQRNWLTVESFSVHRGEFRSNSIKIPTRSFVGMTESILFGIIIRCYPELVSGVEGGNHGWGSEVGGWKEQRISCKMQVPSCK
ncbi:hypothetical protein V513_09355 [Mesotoga sp. H07.pep.5.3]|nr:hypothetical protein V513_09355 [Mesotoga sp. H07.pep.5.3]